MQTITTVAELRHALATARNAGRRVGFVPTMGYLHDGHLALVEASRARSDITVVSIFVNPTQFGPNEDLSTYPRDFLRDEKLCRNAGVGIVFAPDAREVYPAGFEAFVEPAELGKHCAERLGLDTFGASRLSSASCSTWSSRTSRFLDKRIFSNALSYVA